MKLFDNIMICVGCKAPLLEKESAVCDECLIEQERDWAEHAKQRCKEKGHFFMPCACPFEGSKCMYCDTPKGDALVMYHDQYTDKESIL